MQKSSKLEPKDRDRFNNLFQKMVTCIKGLGNYNPAFDDPLIADIAKAIIYTEKAEQWLDKTDDVDVAASATDIIAKRSAMMRQAIEDLAANRRERLKQNSSAEVHDEIEKFVRELMGEKKD